MEKNLQEHEALEALLQGRQEGLDHFFTLYYAALVYFARTLVEDAESARDIVEDAFLRLWQRRDVLGMQGSIKSYLYTSVRNGCIDFRRREKHRRRYLRQQLLQGEPTELPVVHRMVEAETLRLVHQAVESLPRQCGRVFRLFYMEGKPLAEIATEMNLSLSTIKSQKARAIQLLRKRLPPTAAFLMALAASFF